MNGLDRAGVSSTASSTNQMKRTTSGCAARTRSTRGDAGRSCVLRGRAPVPFLGDDGAPALPLPVEAAAPPSDFLHGRSSRSALGVRSRARVRSTPLSGKSGIGFLWVRALATAVTRLDDSVFRQGWILSSAASVR